MEREFAIFKKKVKEGSLHLEANFIKNTKVLFFLISIKT